MNGAPGGERLAFLVLLKPVLDRGSHKKMADKLFITLNLRTAAASLFYSHNLIFFGLVHSCSRSDSLLSIFELWALKWRRDSTT